MVKHTPAAPHADTAPQSKYEGPLRFSLGDDQISVRAKFPAKDSQSPPLDRATFEHALTSAGFGAFARDEQAIARLIKHYNAGKAEDGREPIAHRRDASLTIAISSDKMEVKAQIKPAQGGDKLTRLMIDEALNEASVTFGRDEAAIQTALAATEPTTLIVARGKAPVNGADAQFESLQPEARNRAPQVDENGKVNYRELNRLVLVKPGDPVLRRHPPTLGVSGMTVLSDEVPAHNGRDIPFSKKSKGVVIDPGDGNLLRAECAGQMVLIDHGAIVEPVLNVENVDLKLGNLRFEGTINVSKDVIPGMLVQATGDIVVRGCVEAATLEAGGDIVVESAIIGVNELRDKEGKLSDEVSYLKAGGCIRASFIQHSLIDAQGDVLISKGLVHCEVNSHKGAVRVGRPGASKGGSIVGGVVRSPTEVRARTVGSQLSIITRIEVGADPDLQQELEHLEAELEPKKHEFSQLIRLITDINKNPKKHSEQVKAHAQKAFAQIKQEVTELTGKRTRLIARLANLEAASMIVDHEIETGVELHIGQQVREFKTPTSGGTFCLRNGRIVRLDSDEFSE